MAKEGLDFFPLDCLLDDKWNLLMADCGMTGFAIAVRLLQKIYGEHGYYCEFDERRALLLSGSWFGPGASKAGTIEETVKVALREGIFDRDLFESYGILTSHGIQLRYVEAAKRRTNPTIQKEYLLLSEHEIPKNVCINLKNVYINSKNVCRNPQRKVKESKGDINIVELDSTPYQPIIDYLNEKAATHYRAGSDKTKRLIKARYNEGFSLDDFKQVIDKKCKEWLGTDMEKYLRPETLFGTKFEGYLNQKESSSKKQMPNNKFHNFNQRDYGNDFYDELEAKLLSN